MGTCTCTRREFPDSPLSPLESDLVSHEACLRISEHTVANLVTGLREISSGGFISPTRFRLYVQVFKIEFGEWDAREGPFAQLLEYFRRREGFDLKRLTALAVLLGRGEDTAKADTLFSVFITSQEISKKDVHSLLLTLTDVAYSSLPQFAINRLTASKELNLIQTLSRDLAILKSAQDRVITHWTEKLMQGLPTSTYSDVHRLFANGECKALCSTVLLRQCGRTMSTLVS